ncbi:unnamed protein product [Meganyctiphanes norvegica]|uniref:Brain protein I3 n=1 Tax=Meganyctiphanes norvegica TaxID=48144 RepID=A0AAV2QWK5_MEGNR
MEVWNNSGNPEEKTRPVMDPTVPAQAHIQHAQPTRIAVPTMVEGACPSCRVGVLQSEFTCCGICLGICFFPIGLLCCWAMREKVCTSCQAHY